MCFKIGNTWSEYSWMERICRLANGGTYNGVLEILSISLHKMKGTPQDAMHFHWICNVLRRGGGGGYLCRRWRNLCFY